MQSLLGAFSTREDLSSLEDDTVDRSTLPNILPGEDYGEIVSRSHIDEGNQLSELDISIGPEQSLEQAALAPNDCPEKNTRAISNAANTQLFRKAKVKKQKSSNPIDDLFANID